MHYIKILGLMIAMTLIAACKQQSSADAVTSAASAKPAQSRTAVAVELPASQLLEKKLTKEMPYAELRKIVLAEGWLPLVTPGCRENIGGEALICAEQPEVESCSGDGHCNMQFAHGASQTRMKVGTYADNTKFWEFSSAKTSDKTVSCPSQKFEDFLKRFASDKSVQTAFTLPLIKVEELFDQEEKGLSMRSVYFNKSDYKDFNLAYANDGYHAVFNDEVGGKLVPVEIKPETADAFFVKFQYGVSEGNSYRFKNQEGCWQLTEDPEAPSP